MVMSLPPPPLSPFKRFPDSGLCCFILPEFCQQQVSLEAAELGQKPGGGGQVLGCHSHTGLPNRLTRTHNSLNRCRRPPIFFVTAFLPLHDRRMWPGSVPLFLRMRTVCDLYIPQPQALTLEPNVTWPSCHST